MRFSQISKALDIHPSTLEDHLKRLVDSRIIGHRDSLYLASLNTSNYYNLLRSIAKDELGEYLSKHTMPIENKQLQSEFWRTEFSLMTDLLTIIRRTQESFSEVTSWGFIGGSMDMRLEQSFFELWKPKLENISIEAAFTKKGIEDILEMNLGHLFFGAIDRNKLSLYIIDECSYAMAGTQEGGFLFLPDFSNEVDFRQCLLLQSKTGIEWLNKAFAHLTSNAKKLTTREITSLIGK